MLLVSFGREGRPGKYILDTRIYFRKHKKPEWFQDEFVQRFLKEIDGTTVLFEEALKDKFGHGISTEMMSTGCKTLCCIYFNRNDNLIFYGTAMGDNCYPFLLEMARTRDIKIFLEHYPDVDSKYYEEGLICDENGKPYTEYEFEDAYMDCLAESHEVEEDV